MSKVNWFVSSWDAQLTPPKINFLNPKMKVLKMMFLSKWVMFRFQPLIFRGVTKKIRGQPTDPTTDSINGLKLWVDELLCPKCPDFCVVFM